jgi:glycogen operon protein
LATLFLSQGVPMLAGGDEYGRSQKGNNNAYCQDNEISWLNWERDEDAKRLTEFVTELIAFRKRHAAFRRLDFFRGQPVRGTKLHDVKWLNPNAQRMTDEEWSDHNRCLGIFLNGYLMGNDGKVIEDDFYLLCFNAHHEPVPFVLPAGIETEWEFVMDTADEKGFVRDRPRPKGQVLLEGRSMTVLRLRPPEKFERSTIMDRLLQSMDGPKKAPAANE